MRFQDNEVNFEVECEGRPNYSTTYFMNMNIQMWPQNGPHHF